MACDELKLRELTAEDHAMKGALGLISSEYTGILVQFYQDALAIKPIEINRS